MLQMRTKDGSDKRWFNPGRDMVYAWPRLVKTALETFNEFEGSKECSRDELMGLAKALATLVTQSMKFDMKPEQAAQHLIDIQKAYPGGFKLLAEALLRTGFTTYPIYCDEVKPKTGDDVPLNTNDIDKLIEDVNIVAMRSSGWWFIRHSIRKWMRKLHLAK